jgi:hypothetical protein
MTTPKTWGLFNADGTPLATGDDWHKWKCPRQQFEPCGSEHPVTGEWADDGFTEVPCPFRRVHTKVDRCTDCGIKFIYP